MIGAIGQVDAIRLTAPTHDNSGQVEKKMRKQEIIECVLCMLLCVRMCLSIYLRILNWILLDRYEEIWWL